VQLFAQLRVRRPTSGAATIGLSHRRLRSAVEAQVHIYDVRSAPRQLDSATPPAPNMPGMLTSRRRAYPSDPWLRQEETELTPSFVTRVIGYDVGQMPSSVSVAPVGQKRLTKPEACLMSDIRTACLGHKIVEKAASLIILTFS